MEHSGRVILVPEPVHFRFRQVAPFGVRLLNRGGEAA
jgi:hypothetical protein